MAKILHIEDDENIRDVVGRILRDRGHKVVTLEDGLHATKVIGEERPDLIICDLLMPGLDGFALIEHLKYESELCLIPIMALTGLVGEEDKRIGDELAVDSYMTKPFQSKELLAEVDRLLSADCVKVGEHPHQPQKPKRPYLYMTLAAVVVAIVGILLLLKLL